MTEISPLDPSGGDRERWAIGSLDEADWAARQMLRWRAKRDKVAQEYDDAKERALNAIEREADFFEAHLRGWWMGQVESDPDGDPNEPRTQQLPCGIELRYRPNPIGDSRLTIKDPEAVAAWAAEHGALKPAPVDNKKVKDALKAGEDVPGAHLEDPAWDIYAVTVPGRLIKVEGEEES